MTHDEMAGRGSRAKLLGAGLLAVGAIALAGCGSSSSGGSSDTGTAAAAAATSDAKPWSHAAQFVDCDAAGIKPGCEGETVDGTYTALPASEVTKDWNLCVSFPHLKDSYWLAANYGVISEAKRLGVNADVLDAGGYTNLSKQVSQLDNCVAQGADATVIGAISFDGLDAKVDEFVDNGIAVVDIMNGISNAKVNAHSVVSFYELGHLVGEHLVGLGKPVNVAWFPGPPGAGWVEATNAGFQDAVKGSQVKVLATKYGDTGKDVQLRLVENALDTFPDVDYIAGSAVTAEAAVNALKERGLQDKVKVIANYMIPETLVGLKSGAIECAATDQPVLQAQMGVDEAVRVLEKKPLEQDKKRAMPAPQLVCGPASDGKDNLSKFDAKTTFAPADFKPTFSTD